MMTAGTSVSSRSAATKRLMKEYAELQSSPNYQYTAAPLEDNMFDWHFTIRGPEDSEFENGIYHGRIVLPPQYPYKPPSIYFLTPNGRFELGKKICLSITGYHPETWLPAWGIRTALIALISFMTTEGKDAIGALDYSPEERRILAKKSQSWHCQQCGCKNCEQLLPIPKKENKSEEEDHKKLADMLVVSHEKKETNNNSDSNNDNITSEIVNNNNINENIQTINNNNNNNNNVINSTSPTTESDSNITPNINTSNTNININPTLNNNTSSVEINASSIQQRKSMNSSNASIASSSSISPVNSSSSNTTPSSSNTVNSSTSTTSSQNNLNNKTINNPQANNNNDERVKSLIDAAIIVVFSLLAFLLYYRSTKETKFWNDLD